MKTYQLINLVNEQVKAIVPEKFQELEKEAIIAKIITITTTTKKNLTQAQALQVIYKQLGVRIWKNITQFMKSNLSGIC